VIGGQLNYGRWIEARDAVTVRIGPAEQSRNCLERTTSQPKLSRSVHLGVARENLFDQGRSRARKPNDEYRSVRARSGTGQAGEAIAIERPQETVNIIVVVRKKIVAVTASQLKRDGIRFAQTQRNTFVVAVIPSRKSCRGNGATALLPDHPGAEPSQNKPPRRPCAPAS